MHDMREKLRDRERDLDVGREIWCATSVAKLVRQCCGNSSVQPWCSGSLLRCRGGNPLGGQHFLCWFEVLPMLCYEYKFCYFFGVQNRGFREVAVKT